MIKNLFRKNSVLLIAVLLALVTLQGCSMTRSVKGQVQNSTETFTGTATAYIDGGGTLKMVSSKGAVCEGSFVYITSRQAKGVFNCDDGRSGPFEFVSTGYRGTGFGDFGGERFIFTFGE